MFLIISAILFGIFALNVGLGSFGGGVFLGDVSEMLWPFSAVIAFVMAILKREAAAQEAQDDK